MRMNPRSSNREPGNLSATISDDQLTASFPVSDESLELHVAILGFGIKTDVERGENRNRTLAQEFVTLSHEVHRSGSGTWEVTLPGVRRRVADRLGIALWISKPGNPTPLQAAGAWLPEHATHR